MDLSLLRIPFLFRRRQGPPRLAVLEPAERRWTRDQILLLPLAGVIDKGAAEPSALSAGPGMLPSLKDKLQAAAANPRIKALVLRIDSPGGEVTAADLIHREIVEFKKKRQIPVIAWLGSMAASGGVYVAMAADEIYALPTTITGSIGVITMLPGLMGLGEKIGVEMRVIKSGVNKDLGSPWRPLGDEQREIFAALIGKFYDRFLEVILESRRPKGLTSERLTPLADGRIFDAETARAGGLIDGILYPRELLERVREVAKLRDAKLVTYDYPQRWRGNFYSESPAPSLENLWQLWLDRANLLGRASAGGLGEALDPLHSRAKFMYLWLP